jgi:DNA-binding MarR family transcriptional regulator
VPVAEPPGSDPSTTAAVTGIIRAHAVLSAALASCLRDEGLTEAGFNVLMILDGADEPLCPKDVGDRRLVTRGTVTGVIDRLVELGLVERAPHPDDRRMQLLLTTPSGRKVLRRVLPRVRRAEGEALEGLTAREQRTLAELLTKGWGM